MTRREQRERVVQRAPVYDYFERGWCCESFRILLDEFVTFLMFITNLIDQADSGLGFGGALALISVEVALAQA